jgi:hypothetical protein
MNKSSSYDDKYIEIEYAVFATVHHAFFTKQEHDLHGDVSKIVDNLLKSLKNNQSSTAYLLSVKIQDKYVYISNAKKRQLELWRRSQNQLV